MFLVISHSKGDFTEILYILSFVLAKNKCPFEKDGYKVES